MANQDKDQLAAAENGAGDRSVTESAVSAGEAPASRERAAADAPSAAADQHGADGNGHPGPARDDGRAAAGRLPARMRNLPRGKDPRARRPGRG